MLNLILLSTLTLTASPTHAVAAQPTPCSIWLDRIEAAAVARGFALDRSKGGFSGHSARGTRLSVVCRTDHASVRISDANGTSAALELTGDEGTGRHSFEVTGDFPGIGSITHTHDFEATKAGVRGFSSYAAAAGDEMAVVESSLGQAKLATSGDSEAVNKRFRSALAASDAWRNAQALGFAAAGLLEKLEKTPGPAANTALDAMSTFAVPPADPLYGSKGNAIVACTTSLAVCAVTVFFPIVVSGCVTSSAACLAATACHAASCND